jgi:hypothetical protein
MMLGKDRRRRWGRKEENTADGQKKMLRKDRRRHWGRTEEDSMEEQ